MQSNNLQKYQLNGKQWREKKSSEIEAGKNIENEKNLNRYKLKMYLKICKGHKKNMKDKLKQLQHDRNMQRKRGKAEKGGKKTKKYPGGGGK